MSANDTLALCTPPTTLQEWLAWQETLHVREIDLGLERVRAVAERMDLHRPSCTVVSVAGTNGKGSSVAMLSACLRAAGYRVGTYTSPHLLRYNERIRLDHRPVDDARLCRAFERIDCARAEIPLTYFEFGTLAALDVFAEARPDVVVLEVGLGGRLDAVNLVDADVALVTAVDIDHVEWLGPDRESIAREKAGIFRRGRPAVCADPLPPRAVAAEAARCGARLVQLGRDFAATCRTGDWDFVHGSATEAALPRPRLTGDFQVCNAAGVLMVLQALAARHPVPRTALERGLSEVELYGRFQVVPGAVEVVLDVAHNPQAAASLADNLRARPPVPRTHAVAGMLRDKDSVGVLSRLAPLVDHWHIGGLPGPRGAPVQVLEGALGALAVRAPVAVHDTVEQALASAQLAARPGERVLVFGSFLTVAAASRLLLS